MTNFSKKILFKTSNISDGNMSFRFGEENEVIENRLKFLEKNGIDFENHITMACNHGSVITAVNRDNDAAYLGAKTQDTMIKSEVLVTNEKNLALMLLTADCLPVSFYDPKQRVIALAHLNRKTIAHDLGQKTVGFLSQEFGSDRKDIIVEVGPHIKKESYSFPLPLNEPLHKQLENHIHEDNGHVHLDLINAEIEQLTEVGVLKENISTSEINTATSEEHFSHYRSVKNDNFPQGRMATILMLS